MQPDSQYGLCFRVCLGHFPLRVLVLLSEQYSSNPCLSSGGTPRLHLRVLRVLCGSILLDPTRHPPPAHPDRSQYDPSPRLARRRRRGETDPVPGRASPAADLCLPHLDRAVRPPSPPASTRRWSPVHLPAGATLPRPRVPAACSWVTLPRFARGGHRCRSGVGNRPPTARSAAHPPPRSAPAPTGRAPAPVPRRRHRCRRPVPALPPPRPGGARLPRATGRPARSTSLASTVQRSGVTSAKPPATYIWSVTCRPRTAR